MKYIRVTDVSITDSGRLVLSFSDGKTGVLDCLKFDFRNPALDINNNDIYRTAKIDEAGGLYWDNGYDQSPGCLYEMCDFK